MKRIMLEILPPPAHWDAEKVETWLSKVVDVVSLVKPCCVNIPEVVDEEGPFERPVPFTPKMPVDEFARRLKSMGLSVWFILNRNISKLSEDELMRWIEARVSLDGMKTFLFVGTRTSTKAGKVSVVEAVKLVKENFPEVLIGGIVIFERKDEIERFMLKVEAGMDFFVSQIMVEPWSFRKFISDLRHISGDRKLPLIFVSIPIILSLRDLRLIEWFGVRIPNYLRCKFLRQRCCIESLRFACGLLYDALHVGAGVNLTHLMYKNLDFIPSVFESCVENLAFD